jgi:hypothetical protein
MLSLINFLGKKYFQNRYFQNVLSWQNKPLETQNKIFEYLISQAKNTKFGKEHGFSVIQKIKDFQKNVPVRAYEAFYPYIEKVLMGEENVLWKGKTAWFAKSSGTTNAKSKFIPISKESLSECHFKAGKDMLATYFHFYPDSQLYKGKALSIGGSHQINPLNEHSKYGDLSAVLIQNMPFFYELFRTPPKHIALMSDWETKIETMAEFTIKQNITSIAGVPTWTVVLIQKILEKTKSQDIHQVWKNLEVFFHGAVSFVPYRKQFQKLAPKLRFMEIYNASEGYFAFQTEPLDPSMLLLLNHGVFFEFIPLSQMESDFPDSVPINELELGKTYALVISTNGGLWRYHIGDTVTIVQKNPLKIVIAGRTKHFINAFGEELMVGNTDSALAYACEKTGAILVDYSAAPIYFHNKDAGGHEWIIEFDVLPNDTKYFFELVDNKLQEINTDYAAKRYKNMALRFPVFHIAPKGFFYQWLKSKGKLGGQNKVPRLSNDRSLLEDLLELLSRVQKNQTNNI